MDSTTWDCVKAGIAQRIFDARQDAGLTQQQLGEKMGLSAASAQQIIQAWEHGKRMPSLEQLFSLAEALHTDPIMLLYDYHKEYYTVSNELGLSDETITILREKQLQSELDERLLGMNQFAIAIDSIVSNPELIAMMITYFYSSLDTLTINNLDNHFSNDEAPFLYVKADRVYSFPVSDFEQLYRLQLMDELKKTRDSLFDKRTALLSKYRKRINKVAKEEGLEKISKAVIKAMEHVDSVRED